MLRHPKLVSLNKKFTIKILTMARFTDTPVTQCILDYFERELGCCPPWTNTSRLGLEQCSDEKYLNFLDIFGVRVDCEDFLEGRKETCVFQIYEEDTEHNSFYYLDDRTVYEEIGCIPRCTRREFSIEEREDFEEVLILNEEDIAANGSYYPGIQV